MTLRAARKILKLSAYIEDNKDRWYVLYDDNEVFSSKYEDVWDVMHMKENALTKTPEEALVYYWNYLKRTKNES